MKKPYDITILIYLLLLLWLITACATIKPDSSKQAVLIEVDRVASNKAVLVLKMKDESVIYGQKFRGAGRGHWEVGDRYTVHFYQNQIIKITKNE